MKFGFVKSLMKGLPMDYIIREVLQKHKKSIRLIIASMFLAVIILNILITLTNKIERFQNLVCIILLIIFGVIIFFIVERILTTYVYLLGDDKIGFAKAVGKKESIILQVRLDQIKYIKSLKELEPNADVQNTYYFIYRDSGDDGYFCEFVQNNKLFRFIFKPSERLLRILERKINGENGQKGSKD